MENNIKINLYLTTNDFTKREKKPFKITTKLDIDNNTFIFKGIIPKYVCEYLELNGEEVKCKTLSSSILKDLVGQIENYSDKCIEIKERENAKSEKYLAVKFSESNLQQKDQFNFASMGFKTISSFQYFTIFKDIKHQGSLDRYKYKSDIRIGGERFQKDRKWNYFGVGVIEQGSFKLIRWTQEREDYLKNIQEKFVDINTKLNDFLGNLDEEKINLLMTNKNLLLDYDKTRKD